MMTSSNGNIFRVTGHLCGEFTGQRWTPPKASDRSLMFSFICVWINSWVNNREAGDLRRFRAHYDVIIMSDLIILDELVMYLIQINSAYINELLSMLSFRGWLGHMQLFLVDITLQFHLITQYNAFFSFCAIFMLNPQIMFFSAHLPSVLVKTWLNNLVLISYHYLQDKYLVLFSYLSLSKLLALRAKMIHNKRILPLSRQYREKGLSKLVCPTV